MNQPRVILCERSGNWAIALRRHLPADSTLRQTRGLGEILGELAQSPAALVLVELTGRNCLGVLTLLEQMAGRYPRSATVVLAQRPTEEQRWLMYEAGAVHVVDSPREVGPLAALARRHFARSPAAPAPLAERIWQQLPWADATRV